MRTIFYKGQKFLVRPEVYKPAEDTYLLVNNLEVNPGEKILELGTGCGIVSVIAAKNGCDIVATDINPEAIRCAKENAENHEVRNKIDFREGNLFQPIKDEKFDLIIFNPPYLPVPAGESSKKELETAWDGGSDGREIIDRFLNQVSNYLKPDGRIVFLQSSLSDIQKTFKVLREGEFSIQSKKEKLCFEELYLLKCRYRGSKPM
ncbi:hypothetical protein AKJ38_01620 [candidate division MSBL1 archaeon SCGC-AAA259I14]|uniref:Methyltransferase small domain-containing protein n=1 Tax=candidate division MSBL1 archaeon SCGC-AAA259I14 TaxID=1698268 RepID=A0A133UT15_9EURY|nr:hypothetical protein AKJ38_01620 [candidate division MSBL1 archaeon SCGC-AAA259I14]